MTLDDVVNVLKQLLDNFPEMETPEQFDYHLMRRRAYVQRIRNNADEYSKELENIWAKKAWETVKNKLGKE